METNVARDVLLAEDDVLKIESERKMNDGRLMHSFYLAVMWRYDFGE